MIRLIIASENIIIRAGIRWFLSSNTEIEILGEANINNEAVHLCLNLLPDILLLDLSGSTAVPDHFMQQVKKDHPDLEIIVCFGDEKIASIPELLRLGVRGYVLGDEVARDISQAVSVVANDGLWVSKRVLAEIMDGSRAHPVGKSILTARESEVVKLLGEGLSNEEIAGTLYISIRTVRFHMENLMRKLGASNRTGVFVIARRKGLIDFLDHRNTA